MMATQTQASMRSSISLESYPSSFASTSYFTHQQQEKRPHAYHRRSGTLKTSAGNAEISRQRSQALYKSVFLGEISIDSILSFPIDWQGIAVQNQWNKKRQLEAVEESKEEEEKEDIIPTMNPLAIKNRSRSRQHSQDLSIFSSSSEDHSEADQQSSESQSTVLGLDVPKFYFSATSNRVYVSTSTIASPTTSMEEDQESECPTSPEPSFTFSSPASPSSEYSDCSTYSPTSSSLHLNEKEDQDTSFDLKSYCSAFNEADREEWWSASRRIETV